jgi:ATP-dependent Lon protease
LKRIIREYTYEAGVRNFEREIGMICRKIARTKAERKSYPIRITPAAMEKYLGPPQFFNQEAERHDEVGVATAIAWTENGGEIMPVEVLLMDGKGNLQITGQIGNVMQESAQAALSYLKSRSNQFGINPEISENLDIHIHIPEGAIPKDGPSANHLYGVSFCIHGEGSKERCGDDRGNHTPRARPACGWDKGEIPICPPLRIKTRDFAKTERQGPG